MNQIIPKNTIAVESNWQKELASSFNTLESLCEFLELDPKIAETNSPARQLFPIRVPLHFASLMKKQDINDPLLRQVMPIIEEFKEVEGFISDPLAEHDNEIKGLLHKYESRALLMVKTGCAVNCRYCFRREFPYSENALNNRTMNEALTYIGHTKSLNEVIFSGGDPLMASNRQLRELILNIEKFRHIKRIRIHTRLPVVLPNRIDNEILSIFKQMKVQKVLVFHINHPNEISPEFGNKCLALREAGFTLLNQAVLLKGVNDNAGALQALSENMFEFGILPYYLHLLDRVKGAAHFEVEESKATDIMRELIKRLPGFLVPKLVREIGGQPSKTPIELNLQP